MLAAMLLGMGSARAITISDCVDGGGVVIRCAEQPVTRQDKVTCPAPGKTTKLWCFGGFYGYPEPLAILEFGGDTRYRAR
ncbi:hypothetical protein ACW9HR_26610 [Nocardia gipuzkoensis]|uniref:hypothetical protein n=1 Tax=Nocardia gipuzkoensis TaxID=2749991 RepID=UPI00237E49A9|nr:hypothetical protein [Nocardia gipuzkoensis]MDE1674686.1 hypothetical protein [Nocardia gipuzkoensis]